MKYGSLFTGVGGMDLGFDYYFDCAWQVEWNKECQAILRRHWPTVPKFGDIREVSGEHLSPVEIVTFGSPCQDLSVAGKRIGLAGQRSGMFFEAIRIIREMKETTNGIFPRIVVWENVPGAITSRRGADFATVLDEMAHLGSHLLEWAIVDAQYFGIPQRRRRIFLVSILDPDLAGICPEPLLPLREIAYRNRETDRTIAFYRTHGRHDQPQVGISPPLKVVSPICIASSSTVPRILTPIEHERLMGWPDDYTRWTDDGREQRDSHRFRQCGNGVATPVAKWVARQIADLMRESDRV